MAETNEVQKIEVQAASYTEVINVDGARDKDFIVITVGTSKRCIHKYELVMPSFNVEMALADGASLQDLSDWLMEARNLDLQQGINTMLRSLSTRPAYDMYVDKESDPVVIPDPSSTPEKPKADFVDYNLKEGGHKSMQELLDAYRAGQRPSSEKKEQARLGAAIMGANKDNILSQEEIADLIKKAAAKKTKK